MAAHGKFLRARLTWIVFVLWTAAACRTGAKDNQATALLAEAAVPPVITYAALRSQAEANPESLSNVTALIASLPESLRSNYALIFKSLGLQKASLEFPRIVLFGPDAQFVASFNGSPQHGGHREMEVIQWNQEGQAFEFYRIEEEDGHLAFSEKNPELCGGCHTGGMGDDDPRHLRPNWESFAAWPGVFAGGISTPVGLYAGIAAGSSEEAAVTAFKANAGNHPRYKTLLNVESKYVGTDPHDPNTSPNNDLVLKLKALNGQRIARWITSDPDYAKIRPALTHALANCEDFETLIPAELKTAPPEELQDTLEAALHSYAVNPTNLDPSVVQDVLKTGTLEPLAKVRRIYQFKSQDIDHWTMSFGIRDSFLDVNGDQLIHPLLLRELQVQDPTFDLPTCAGT